MGDLPAFVRICEEGPREGFQSEPPGIATDAKVRLIDALSRTGLRDIACCSFVDGRRVPQMADAEQIAARIARAPDVRHTGLWLNAAGFARARATPLDLTGLVVAAASETFGIRNNNRDRAGMNDSQRRLIDAYLAAGVTRFTAYVFTAFGCNFEGDITDVQAMTAVHDLMGIAAEKAIAFDAVYLCDTVGYATPALVERRVGDVRSRWPEAEIALHLHDTRGIGMANAVTGLKMGVARFDSSIGGLGGCPFAGNKAAAGNLCTEDFAYLCAEMGIATGLDLDALVECASDAEMIVGHPLPGKLKQAGLPRR